MFVGTLFWVLAQQGGSTISLFIDRFVNRQAFNIEVPLSLIHISRERISGWLSAMPKGSYAGGAGILNLMPENS